MAHAILFSAKFYFVGIHPSKRLCEQIVGIEDALTYEYDKYLKILRAINNWGKSLERMKDGKTVEKDFIYDRENNSDLMSDYELCAWIQ